MININQTSEQTKILIPRSNINGDIEKNNYVTEDELQEILKDNSIPYIVIDGSSFSGFEITKGNWGAVHNAIQNNKPYLIYANSSNNGTIFSLVDDINPHPQGGASIATTLITANRKVTYRAWIIDIDGNVELRVEETYTIQPKLVSGENIKTINGNDILGEGDIVIESGTDIPYLIIDNLSILDGDFDAVYDAINNNQPYLIYKKRPSDGWLFTDDSASVKDNYIDVIFCVETYDNEDKEVNLYYTSAKIYPDKVDGIIDRIIDMPTQFKTINGSSLLGSGDITIVGSGSEILYLYKSTDDTAIATHKNHNINIRNKILSLTSTEQYPIIILKDWYNDTICNNVYARDGYVEIQCCNSRIFGEYSELTDERYELNNKGVLVKLEDNTFASKAYVDEQISNVSGGGGSGDFSNYYTKGEIDNMVGDIETILDNLIGNN